jgi:CspA family cold shock protein
VRFSRTSTVFGALRLLSPSFPAAAASGRPAFGLALSERRNTTMTTGTVKFFNADKGYGFIAPDGGGQDAFVHITALESSGINTLNQNDRVTYDLENDKRGKQAAVNVKMAAE